MGLPVGVNILRNDVAGAVAIAAATGARFVRANVYVGASLTDQGLIEGAADAVQALIRRLGAPVAVWADVDVNLKHAVPVCAASPQRADARRDRTRAGRGGHRHRRSWTAERLSPISNCPRRGA